MKRYFIIVFWEWGFPFKWRSANVSKKWRHQTKWYSSCLPPNDICLKHFSVSFDIFRDIWAGKLKWPTLYIPRVFAIKRSVTSDLLSAINAQGMNDLPCINVSLRNVEHFHDNEDAILFTMAYIRRVIVYMLFFCLDVHSNVLLLRIIASCRLAISRVARFVRAGSVVLFLEMRLLSTVITASNCSTCAIISLAIIEALTNRQFARYCVLGGIIKYVSECLRPLTRMYARLSQASWMNAFRR